MYREQICVRVQCNWTQKQWSTGGFNFEIIHKENVEKNIFETKQFDSSFPTRLIVTFFYSNSCFKKRVQININYIVIFKLQTQFVFVYITIWWMDILVNMHLYRESNIHLNLDMSSFEYKQKNGASLQHFGILKISHYCLSSSVLILDISFIYLLTISD